MSDRIGTEEAGDPGSRGEWDQGGTRADLYRGDDWIGSLRLLDDWFSAGSRLPETAWVVEWRDEDSGALFGRALAELTARPALSQDRRADLTSRAWALIKAPLDPPPAPFGVASTDLDSSQGLRDRIEAISHSLQAAEHRLAEAAAITGEWGSVKVLVALSEALAWLRVLDEVLRFTWRRAVLPSLREAESRRIDEAIRARGELPDFVEEGFAERRRRGSPYTEWTLLLLDRGLALSPGDLQGLRWLAGKMLHYGPLPVVELRQVRQGAPPRWMWRSATEIFPHPSRERSKRQRHLYETHLARQAMLPKFKLTFMLIEMELLFGGMIRKSSQGGILGYWQAG